MLLAVIFLGSMTMLLRDLGKYREGQEIYALAEQAAQAKPEREEAKPPQQPEEPSGTPESAAPVEEPLQDISVAALREQSRDVVGWVRIPDTQLSYPLMQGTDNDYYLSHAWNGWETIAGSIFMDYQCSADLTGFNTIIYGHRMKDSSMFSTLKGYNKLEFWQEHPIVYIKDREEQVHRYEIFAAYEAPVRSYTYEKNPADDAVKQAVIDFALENSVIDTAVVPEITQRILTMSTCTGKGYDTRWVVQAVERINP